MYYTVVILNGKKISGKPDVTTNSQFNLKKYQHDIGKEIYFNINILLLYELRRDRFTRKKNPLRNFKNIGTYS